MPRKCNHGILLLHLSKFPAINFKSLIHLHRGDRHNCGEFHFRVHGFKSVPILPYKGCSGAVGFKIFVYRKLVHHHGLKNAVCKAHEAIGCLRLGNRPA